MHRPSAALNDNHGWFRTRGQSQDASVGQPQPAVDKDILVVSFCFIWSSCPSSLASSYHPFLLFTKRCLLQVHYYKFKTPEIISKRIKE